MPANLATDELELVIFAKTKSHSKIERVDDSATLAFGHWSSTFQEGVRTKIRRRCRAKAAVGEAVHEARP